MLHTGNVRYLVGILALHATSLNAEWNTKDFQKREHSLTKPYQGSGFGVPNWDFQGSTMVTSNYIRLTPDQKSKQGALWNKIPCRVRNWEIQINFKVTGSTRDLFGDGFAFWYTKERMEIGPVFGSKDFFSGLAIIGDTYSNHNNPNHQLPYLSAMVNNGSVSYDHEKDGKHTMLGGCQLKFRNKNHETWIAIRYENDKLTISSDINDKRAWAPCFSTEGVKLPTGYYFGMSATTGDLSDAHDVISVKTYELDTAAGVPKEERPDIEPESEFIAAAPKKQEEDSAPSMSGVKKFFIGLLVVLGILVVVVVGIMMYQKQQENNRKRFY